MVSPRSAGAKDTRPLPRFPLGPISPVTFPLRTGPPFSPTLSPPPWFNQPPTYFPPSSFREMKPPPSGGSRWNLKFQSLVDFSLCPFFPPPPFLHQTLTREVKSSFLDNLTDSDFLQPPPWASGLPPSLPSHFQFHTSVCTSNYQGPKTVSQPWLSDHWGPGYAFRPPSPPPPLPVPSA